MEATSKYDGLENDILGFETALSTITIQLTLAFVVDCRVEQARVANDKTSKGNAENENWATVDTEYPESLFSTDHEFVQIKDKVGQYLAEESDDLNFVTLKNIDAVLQYLEKTNLPKCLQTAIVICDSPTAMFTIGLWYRKGIITASPIEAIVWLKRSAALKNRDALNVLGFNLKERRR